MQKWVAYRQHHNIIAHLLLKCESLSDTSKTIDKAVKKMILHNHNHKKKRTLFVRFMSLISLQRLPQNGQKQRDNVCR